jgi:hypothetical protein
MIELQTSCNKDRGRWSPWRAKGIDSCNSARTVTLGLGGLSCTHQEISELREQSSLERFGHEIAYHIAGGTPLDAQFLIADTIRHKEVPDVDVLGALATRGFAIFFEENGALIILEQDILGHIVTLSLQEVPSPTYCRHAVFDADKFRFRGAPRVNLLFGGSDNWKTLSQSGSSASLATKILMGSVGSIHIPLDDTTCVCTQNQGEGFGSVKVPHEMGEFLPVIGVRFSHSGGEECDCRARVRTGSLGSVQSFGNQVVEGLSHGRHT